MDERADCVLTFPATFEAFARAFAELRRALDLSGLAARPRYRVELVFEEVVSNIIRHGCPGDHKCAIEVVVGFNRDAVVLAFQDNAKPFDLRSHGLPPAPRTLDQAARGGLGLVLVHKACNSIDYRRTQDQNNLTLTISTEDRPALPGKSRKRA